MLDKIEDKSAVVGVLGLGYVGLPLASAFLEAGFRVMGFDTDPAKIEALQRRARTTSSTSGSDWAERMLRQRPLPRHRPTSHCWARRTA